MPIILLQSTHETLVSLTAILVSAVVLFNDGHHIWEVVERTYNLGKKVLKRLKYANDRYSEL